jgi:hypothetical protein
MKPKPEPAKLPPDVTPDDLKWPAPVYEGDRVVQPSRHLPYSKLKELGLQSDELLFYKTARFGWVLTTLLIAKGRGNQPARYYGISVTDGQTVRVGRGPHVTDEVTVHLSTDNLERLMRYIKLWNTGMENSGTVRDRISSRRAQGQIERAAGHSSWRWDA